MTFGLPSWLKSKFQELGYEVPIWYPSHDQPDRREWLITNGLGGYASGTISGAETRRYHAALVSALTPPTNRHIILSKVDEVVTLDGVDFELATNYWASAVVAPTGYKLLESFTILPTPTWVYNLNGHYLIKQIALQWNTDQIYIGYYWLPDSDDPPQESIIKIRFLTAFRDFHHEMQGSIDKRYSQIISKDSALINLDGTRSRLHLKWNRGSYESAEQWWWDYHWAEEAALGMPDQEDLFHTGTLTANLDSVSELSLCGSFNQPVESSEIRPIVESNFKRQKSLLVRAALPRTSENNLLVLACDQFLCQREVDGKVGETIVAGYPWFNDSGREALVSLPGLTLATRRFDEGKLILETFAKLEVDGLMPNRFSDGNNAPNYKSADVSLWWAWALYQYYRATQDLDFVRQQYPTLKKIAKHYVNGTKYGIKTDPEDGLIVCGKSTSKLTWMDRMVAEIPITPRGGKVVELCALWYNLLQVLNFFAGELKEKAVEYQQLAKQVEKSMQKFWNDQEQCLFDVIEPDGHKTDKPDDSIRPNQLLAISLPFRTLTKLQEKSILSIVERELVTPLGLRTLSPRHPSYQGSYGCGLEHPDEYHRDLSQHQGTVAPWLIGPYCDALLNIFGPLPETYSRIRILLQPLINNLIEEGCVGSISELFDGNAPHMPHGTYAAAWSVAETMRMLALVLKS